jgi:hypothetical protein
MRIPPPHLLVVGLTITAVGLVVLTPWLVVVGALVLSTTALITMLSAPIRRGGQAALPTPGKAEREQTISVISRQDTRRGAAPKHNTSVR